MIILDTEYTTWPGALESGWSHPNQHREIVQIAAIKVNSDFEEIKSLNLLVKPTINYTLSPLFVDLTHITQNEVDNNGTSFQCAYMEVMAFSEQGKVPIICMNGDEKVFRENCLLNGIGFVFEKEWYRLWPFLVSTDSNLSKISSGDLHQLTGQPLAGHTHNALHDVRSMAHWLKWAKSQAIFTRLDQLPQGVPSFDHRSNHASTLQHKI